MLPPDIVQWRKARRNLPDTLLAATLDGDARLSAAVLKVAGCWASSHFGLVSNRFEGTGEGGSRRGVGEAVCKCCLAVRFTSHVSGHA